MQDGEKLLAQALQHSCPVLVDAGSETRTPRGCEEAVVTAAGAPWLRIVAFLWAQPFVFEKDAEVKSWAGRDHDALIPKSSNNCDSD